MVVARAFAVEASMSISILPGIVSDPRVAAGSSARVSGLGGRNVERLRAVAITGSPIWPLCR